MQRFWEAEHSADRAIKTGALTMSPAFAALADWIAAEYDVPRPLHVRLDAPEDSDWIDRHRLDVVFEYEGTANLFRSIDSANWDFEKRDAIKAKFLGLYPPMDAEAARRLFVIFHDFEREVRERANRALSETQIKRIASDLRPLNIWKIVPMGPSAVFFFKTDAERDASADNGALEQCRARYNEDLLVHDEFGYFERRAIEVRAESRETFKRDYGGSWQSFLR